MQARHEAMQKDKIKAYKLQLQQTTDPIAAMLLLERGDHIRFLTNNKVIFDKHEMFERAVLKLFFRKNTPFFLDGQFDTWIELFRSCDRDRLRKEGSPLPHTKTTAYRGSVTSVTKGISWTLDKNKVEWILNRWSDKTQGGGTVYAMEISDKDIIYHIHNNERHEIILHPDLAVHPEARIITALD